ncbi:MAG: hypothetical protein HQM06_03120 [Magnetococcales bacterium]|nr:hypothetical protein [Magnetococcales bacterium]
MNGLIEIGHSIRCILFAENGKQCGTKNSSGIIYQDKIVYNINIYQFN